MIAVPSNIVNAGLLLLFTLASGIWLSRKARPISAALLTVHKLIALGTVISAGFAIYRSRAGIAGWQELAAAAFAAALVVSLFSSGALLSGKKKGQAPVLSVHRIAALLVTALAAATATILSSAAL